MKIRTDGFHHSGFTLLEIMIVIAILLLTYVMMLGFTQNPSIYRERTVRLQSYIADQLKSARTDTMIGRGVQVGAGVKMVSEREVYISTGSVEKRYNSGGIFVPETTLTGALTKGFFDGDTKYKLKYVYWDCGASGGFSTGTILRVSYVQGKDPKFYSGGSVELCSGSSNVKRVGFVVGYETYTGTGEVNGISGVISTLRVQQN